MKKIGAKAALVIDGRPVRFEEIIAVAIDGLPVRISRSRAFLKRMSATEKALMTSLESGVAVYGLKTDPVSAGFSVARIHAVNGDALLQRGHQRLLGYRHPLQKRARTADPDGQAVRARF